jgi:ABC-type multidrug transport system fused ATPase/permease subunit
MVNTLADLRGMLAAVERVNNVVASAQVDEWLAHGLEREARGELQGNGDCVNPTTNEIVASEEDAINGSTIPLKVATTNLPAVESQRTVCDLAWSGDVVLEDVHFAYPLRPEAYVLKGITLKLNRGTVTAVVGSSGAGKSTIVQLLARFYEVCSTSIWSLLKSTSCFLFAVLSFAVTIYFICPSTINCLFRQFHSFPVQVSALLCFVQFQASSVKYLSLA